MATPSTNPPNQPASASSNASQPSPSTPTEASSSFPAQNSSLYVGELLTDVTEAMLFEIFNQIGPVASIRVCRDAVTRRSLGYAYVNFHNPADCEKAIDQLNFSLIKGKQCRIMWSQRDPSLRKKGLGNIFIKNLDKSIDSKALYDTFSAFGNILSCKVATDENGSKGYGFVHYETMEAAEKAIQAVNGMLINDKMVFVGLHVSRKERESKEEEIKKQFTNVFIKNLPDSITEQQFLDLVNPFGEHISAALSTDEQGNTKCFGFVNYVDHQSAAKCVEDLNGKEMDGKVLYAGRAQPKKEREEELRKKFEQMRIERINKFQGVNLYVKNLDETIDDKQLRDAFAPFGTITSARVMRDEKDGSSRGFAFVCFSQPEEATKALSEMHGKLIGSKPVYVALAQRKEARRAMLETQFQNRLRQQGMMPMYGAPMMYPGQMPPMPGQQPPMMYPQMGAAGVRPMFMPPFMRMPQQPQGQQRPPAQQGGQPRPQTQRPQQMYPMAAQGAAARPPAQQQQQQRYPNGQAPQAQPAVPALSASMLSKMEPAQQRQVLGERLYPLVQNHPLVKFKHKDMAGKITGMLLEMEVSELLHLLENADALQEKLEEAVSVLEAFLQQQQQAAPQQE